MTDYRFYASEVCEEGERISADKILREIHDSMCMCGEVIDCDTEGVAGTVIEAATALLSCGHWSHDFEDGWLKVETISPAQSQAAPRQEGKQ